MSDPMRAVDPRTLKDNPFKLMADDWMLITAGKLSSYNTMTASWGALGELWNKKVCFCFVRPTRYTFQFMERDSLFTLSFFDEAYRSALDLCGAVSGRDIDKVREAGLTAIETKSNVVCFSEARLVLECRKIYAADLESDKFLDPGLEALYPKKDYHRMYIGEILNCLMK